MIYSMTGFAAGEREVAAGTLLLELRAVNHRYLELHLRMDDALRSFEPAVREAIGAKLGRGKVECRLALAAPTGAAAGAEVDGAMLDQLAKMSAQVLQRFPDSRPLDVAIFCAGGRVATEPVNGDALRESVDGAAGPRLRDLAEARARKATS